MMCKALLIASSLLTFSVAATACDPGTDESTIEARQLQDAELALEDALAAVDAVAPEAVVLDVEFEAGVEAGYFQVIAVDGDDVVTFEIEAEAERGDRAVREVDRRRARAERLARARAHRHARRRLAAALARHRDRRDGERPFRARLLDDDAEVDLMDRRGAARRVRLALQ